ncbi:Prolipoprotein diacylglyceryl transferase, partial [Metamycoplasma alkalescens]
MLENSLAFKILPQIIREHMFINGHYRLPLFLYESVANLIGYIILVW